MQVALVSSAGTAVVVAAEAHRIVAEADTTVEAAVAIAGNRYVVADLAVAVPAAMVVAEIEP